MRARGGGQARPSRAGWCARPRSPPAGHRPLRSRQSPDPHCSQKQGPSRHHRTTALVCTPRTQRLPHTTLPRTHKIPGMEQQGSGAPAAGAVVRTAPSPATSPLRFSQKPKRPSRSTSSPEPTDRTTVHGPPPPWDGVSAPSTVHPPPRAPTTLCRQGSDSSPHLHPVGSLLLLLWDPTPAAPGTRWSAPAWPLAPCPGPPLGLKEQAELQVFSGHSLPPALECVVRARAEGTCCGPGPDPTGPHHQATTLRPGTGGKGPFPRTSLSGVQTPQARAETQTPGGIRQAGPLLPQQRLTQARVAQAMAVMPPLGRNAPPPHRHLTKP